MKNQHSCVQVPVDADAIVAYSYDRGAIVPVGSDECRPRGI